MKKTILPALAMLIISAVMLSTASYAWFAMGNEVRAENMNVSVKSDSTYLVIAKASDKDTVTVDGVIKSGYTEQAVGFATDPAKKLYPVAYGYTSTIDGDKTTYTPTPYANKAYTFTGNDVWYTMEGIDSANGDGKEGTLTPLTNAQVLADYVLLNSVIISVSKGSNKMYDLQAKIEVADGGDDAINVLVVVGNKYQRFVYDESGDDYGTISLADEVTDAPIQVDIYVFYDGDHDNITTNELGLGNIEDTSVTVKFTASSSDKIQ